MVEPLDFLDERQLLGFLRIKKTELSLMENSQTFVTQLRDYSLISEERYKKISRMKSKENIRSALYSALDLIEKEKPKLIYRFWKCAFKESILNKFPTLRLLRNSLYDGSYESESALLEGVGNEEGEDSNRKKTSEEEETGERKNKKRKRTTKRVGDEDEGEEQAGPSAQVSTRSRKKKICFSSPLKKGEKGDIWTWDIYKVQLPVTCGDQKGTLNRNRLAKGEKCILEDKQWYTPSEFERLAGKASSKNWKSTIRCIGTPLGKLIEEGHLKTTGYSKGPKAKKSLFPSEKTVSQDEDSNSSTSTHGGSLSDSTDEEDSEEQNQIQSATKDGRNKVLKVSCEDISGFLHTKRFASGTCGKSIRTDTAWMTPVDFVKEASCQTDVSWKLQIKSEGEPLGDLIKAKGLEIHSLLCTCSLCVPDSEDLDDEKNDDECWICGSDQTEKYKLVECDDCPRSFHQKCHLPHVEDTLLDDERRWMCTLCVFEKSVGLYPELTMESAMTSAISDHMLQCQYLLLGLYRADEDCVFTTDPCHIKDYTSVIRKPMWFGRIAEKLQDKQYQAVGEFVSDVRLIFTNCASFNRNNPEFCDIGTKMTDFFERELNSTFKIQEVGNK